MTDYPTEQHLKEWSKLWDYLNMRFINESNKIQKDYFRNRLESVKRLLELKK